MTEVLGVACIVEVGLMALLLVRLAMGPTVGDRVVAMGALSVQAAVAVLLYAAFADRTIYLDVALWMASFSFLSGLFWARYLERGLL